MAGPLQLGSAHESTSQARTALGMHPIQFSALVVVHSLRPSNLFPTDFPLATQTGMKESGSWGIRGRSCCKAPQAPLRRGGQLPQEQEQTCCEAALVAWPRLGCPLHQWLQLWGWYSAGGGAWTLRQGPGRNGTRHTKKWQKWYKSCGEVWGGRGIGVWKFQRGSGEGPAWHEGVNVGWQSSSGLPGLCSKHRLPSC